ncbi:MAG: SCO family protein [Gammaproteobacteria bacterium]|nr:SCO family protein [Gammaproteobacteria bacterium]
MTLTTRPVNLLGMILSLAILSSTAGAQEYDTDAALAQSQGVLGKPLGNHSFRDTNGQRFDIDQLAGKPLVVSMIYTSCHHVCPRITRNVQETVEIAREALGEDSFAVVTVGFDWRVDTPDRMRLYARQFGIDDTRWHFLSGDESSIDALARAVGFQFYASPKGFDHLSQTTVVAADSNIYRQVYGESFDTPELVEPLKELVFNTPREAGVIEHWVDSFKLFCTVYDPNTGRYAFDYSIFMSIFVGVMCLGAVATFVAREWKHAR